MRTATGKMPAPQSPLNHPQPCTISSSAAALSSTAPAARPRRRCRRRQRPHHRGRAPADRGHREIDATGLLVTPGFVDIHTHYDGQATWDPYLTPSSWHGVTTVVFGNCGVGFAPVRPGAAPYLINLMEGVEDIPGTVLAEGVKFDWESFPEYLDALAATPKVIDIGAQVPHGALRFYVMGERGADHAQTPTDAEIDAMGDLLEEALRAGALGFTTSRTIKHRAKDGRFTPSLSAREPELFGLAAR